MTAPVARLALVDRLMAALLDGPATTDELCARMGSVVSEWHGPLAENGFGYTVRAIVALDLEDILDDLSLAHAIGGHHVFGSDADDGMPGPPVVQWVRLLPRAADHLAD